MSEPTLPNVPPDGLPTLSQLHEEQRARWERGARVPVERYLAWYPALRADDTALLDLVYNEVLLREEAGEAPQLGEYLARFPHLADPLREQFEVHRALGSDHLFAAAPTLLNPPPPGGGGGLRRPVRPAPEPPDVPGFEILDELGRGGAGVVYRAWQTGLKRTAALKMLLAGPQAGPHELARLRTEAQAAGRLHHPNIVQVYEVGPEGGPCYIAMEYVEGGSLARKLAGGPLPAGPAAALAETLARAVHHAHRQQVIHRDLKPANVLLTADATPKITDFGLAKFLVGGAGQTLPGSILGTPSYMAPEQAHGDTPRIGPAVDVYALGALLYELLTGRPPFQGADLFAILEQVRAHEPVPPRRLQPKLPRDLETICLKCLEKEPGQRYPTAEALADDLRRFQAGEPITARPAGATERLLKWARRRPAAAALLGVIGLALAVLVAVWVSFTIRLDERRREADKESTRAEKEAQFAKQQSERAAKGFQMAVDAVDKMLTEVAEEELATEPRTEEKRRRLLERALHFYQKLRELHDDPALRKETGLAHRRLADVLRLLGRNREAEEAYGQAIALLRDLAGGLPSSPEFHQALAGCHNWHGELLRTTSRPAEARAAYDSARRLQEQLVADFPEVPDYRRDLAQTHYNLGILLRECKELRAARQEFQGAIDRLRSLADQYPKRPGYRQHLARSHLNRGPVLRADGDPRGAERSYREAIRLLEQLRDEHPYQPDYRHELGVAHNNLGNLFVTLKQPARAEEHHRAAIDLFARLAVDFPSIPAYRSELANSHNSLGTASAQAGDLPEAARNWCRARELFAELLARFDGVADYHGRLGMTLGHLGWLKEKEGEPGAAGRSFEAAARHLKAALRPNALHPEYRERLRDQYQNLAHVRVRLGDHAGAAGAARDLAGVFPDCPLDAYYAACFTARCIPLAEKDARLRDPAARQALAREYADGAVGFLRQALGRGGHGIRRVPDERAVFAPLAGRPDFEEARRGLDARTKPPAAPPGK